MPKNCCFSPHNNDFIYLFSIYITFKLDYIFCIFFSKVHTQLGDSTLSKTYAFTPPPPGQMQGIG